MRWASVSSLRSLGLSLVEVLVALVLVAIAVTALTMSQATSLRVSRASVLASDATQIANESLEVLTQRVLEDFGAYQLCPGTSICSGSTDRGQFVVDFRISRGVGYEFEGLIEIDVVVDGPSSAELEHYVSCMDVSPPPTVTNPGVCI